MSTKSTEKFPKLPITRWSWFGAIRHAYRERRDAGDRLPLLRGLKRGIARKRRVERILNSRPPYSADTERIIIDVTHFCNLGCRDCNRSCGKFQANSDDKMSIAQIEKFIAESIAQNRKWKLITIEGGEPTAHPEILRIVDLITEYRRVHSPKTAIDFATNGYAEASLRSIEKLPPNVQVINSSKDVIEQEHHTSFNIAPIDYPEPPKDDLDFSNGCILPAAYGIGLNRSGYYPHAICGGIDRVFGLNVGRKELPKPGDSMTDVYSQLCRYCGHYRDSNVTLSDQAVEVVEVGDGGQMSKAWQSAYANYRRRQPKLDPY